MQRGDGPDETKRLPRAGGPPGLCETQPIGAPTRSLGAPGGTALGGRYRLTGVLGAGGDDVHRAVDMRLNRPVAVQIFRSGADPGAEHLFGEQAQVLANLSHPALIPVHDFGVEPNCAYLVSELVEGPTLRGLLDRERVPLVETARIGAEIANVLAHLHSQGVVHGEVDPSNVLLDHGRRVRLGGVGVSRLAGATGLTAGHPAGGYPAPSSCAVTTSVRRPTSTRSASCCWRRSPATGSAPASNRRRFRGTWRTRSAGC